METVMTPVPRELDTILAAGEGPAAQAVRAWLEDCWRHGEIVTDADGMTTAAGERPLDRFQPRTVEQVH